MRIASFNVENLDDRGDQRNPTLAHRAPILRQVFNRINADILCLQEVHGQETEQHTSDDPDRVLSALDEVVAGTEFKSFYRVHTVTSANTPYNERNLVILSRYPIVAHEQYRNDLVDDLMYRKVTELPDPQSEARDVSWERPILHARIDHPQLGVLHVINLHLKSRLPSNIAGQKDGFEWNSAAGWAEGYFLSSLKRVGQALETRLLLDQIFANEPEARVVVTGDFNAEPGEVPVEAICGRVENTNNPGLRSTVLVPCSEAIAQSVRYSHLHHGQGNLLDHMLISQSLLAHFDRARIFNENLHDESLPFTFDSKYPESDHAPFVSDFIV